MFFLSNNFKLAAATIAAIYKERWQIELFFKAIKPGFPEIHNDKTTNIWKFKLIIKFGLVMGTLFMTRLSTS